MKGSTCIVAVYVSIILLVPASMFARPITDHPNPIQGDPCHGHEHSRWPKPRDGNMIEPDFHVERRLLTKRSRAVTLRIAGSKIPDCSHACGSCSPCQLVMVRFACALPTEAETCPVAYKCMCNGKSYPVP